MRIRQRWARTGHALPWNNNCNTVSELTADLGPGGVPLTTFTSVHDDQPDESWLWDPDFEEWGSPDFAIDVGVHYMFVAVVDTTWNPTEYTNEAKGTFLAHSKQSNVEQYCGVALASDRVPEWVIETSSKRIDYALPRQSAVEMVIYDVSGRRVTSLVSGMHRPDYYSAVWHAHDGKGRKVSSGIYFVRLEAGEFKSRDKILLVK